MSDIPFFDEEMALSDLLAAGELFCFDADGNGDFIGLAVLCNDSFLPGADEQGFRLADLPSLHAAWKSEKWGVTKWVALKRGMRPRPKLVKMMQEAGVWTPELEALTTKMTY